MRIASHVAQRRDVPHGVVVRAWIVRRVGYHCTQSSIRDAAVRLDPGGRVVDGCNLGSADRESRVRPCGPRRRHASEIMTPAASTRGVEPPATTVRYGACVMHFSTNMIVMT